MTDWAAANAGTIFTEYLIDVGQLPATGAFSYVFLESEDREQPRRTRPSDWHPAGRHCPGQLSQQDRRDPPMVGAVAMPRRRGGDWVIANDQSDGDEGGHS